MRGFATARSLSAAPHLHVSGWSESAHRPVTLNNVQPEAKKPPAYCALATRPIPSFQLVSPGGGSDTGLSSWKPNFGSAGPRLARHVTLRMPDWPANRPSSGLPN